MPATIVADVAAKANWKSQKVQSSTPIRKKFSVPMNVLDGSE